MLECISHDSKPDVRLKSFRSRSVGVPSRGRFWGGGGHRADHHGNLGDFFHELERSSTMARSNGFLSVKDLLPPAAEDGLAPL